MRRRSLSGSPIAGIAETQEMLDFCGKHNITADVEVIPIQKINEAYERLLKSDVKYRFSIDMASLKSEWPELFGNSLAAAGSNRKKQREQRLALILVFVVFETDSRDSAGRAFGIAAYLARRWPRSWIW